METDLAKLIVYVIYDVNITHVYLCVCVHICTHARTHTHTIYDYKWVKIIDHLNI